MAHSCRGVCLLQEGDIETQIKCFRIGQHLGIAFQLIDDILDFTVSSEDLGKNSLSDIKEGNLNGPVLFAVHEAAVLQQDALYNEMTKKLTKKFVDLRDLNKSKIFFFILNNLEFFFFFLIFFFLVNDFVAKSAGIEKTRYLAMLHALKAVEAAEDVLEGKNAESFYGIVDLALKTVTRKK